MSESPKHQIWITEAEFELVIDIINEKITKHKGYVNRAIENPSETIKSSQTVDRHRKVIYALEDLEKTLVDQLQF